MIPFIVLAETKHDARARTHKKDIIISAAAGVGYFGCLGLMSFPATRSPDEDYACSPADLARARLIYTEHPSVSCIDVPEQGAWKQWLTVECEEEIMQILLAVKEAVKEGSSPGGAATVTVHVTRTHLRARSVDARGARMHKQRCGGRVCDSRVYRERRGLAAASKAVVVADGVPARTPMLDIVEPVLQGVDYRVLEVGYPPS